MITHYLPQWLLREFRDSGLWELNVQTRAVEKRSLENAGSDDDLWPPHIESDIMTTQDTEAGKIFRKRIRGRDKIVLTEDERLTFAKWLALFIPRVPHMRREMDSIVAEANSDPEAGVRSLYRNPMPAIEITRRESPKQYQQIMDLLGEAEGHRWILNAIANWIRTGRLNTKVDPNTAYHGYLKDVDLEHFASFLCRHQWVWARSRFGFCIGDNPLMRWGSLRNQRNVGLARPSVEISIPLGSHLCLFVRRRHRRYDGTVLYVGRNLTKQMNARQRGAATLYAYAGNQTLLRNQAKYGFSA